MPRPMKEIAPAGNAAEIAKAGESLANTPKLYQTAQSDGQVTEFPQPLFKRDPYSQRVQLKQAAQEALPGRQIAISEEDISYLHRLQQQDERAAFNVFMSNLFDRARPAERAMLLKIFPEYEKIRKEIIRQQADIQIKLAELQITGIQNHEDAMFVWALNRGDIQLPSGPLYDPKTYTENNGTMYISGPLARKFKARSAIDVKKLNERLGFTNVSAGTTAKTPFVTDFGSNDPGSYLRNLASTAFGTGGFAAPAA